MDAGRPAEHALVQAVQQRHRLGAGGAGAAEFAAQGADPGVGGQREAEHLAVAPQPRALDRRVRGVGGLGQAPADLQRVREPDRHRDHELALAARPRDGDAAAEVADRVVVALAEELGEAQVVGGVQPAGERAVVERVQARRGVGARRLRVGDLAQPERAVAVERGRDGLERRGAERGGGGLRACAPTDARSAKSLSYSASTASSTSRSAAAHESSSPSSARAPSSRAWAAEWRPSRFSHIAQPAVRRARTGASSGPTSASPSSSDAERLLQPPRRGQRLREPDEQLEPPRHRLGGLGQQPQRGAEAVGGGRGRAGGGVAAGLDQDLQRLVVTRAARSAPDGARERRSSRRARLSAAAARAWAAIRQPSAADA